MPYWKCKSIAHGDRRAWTAWRIGRLATLSFCGSLLSLALAVTPLRADPLEAVNFDGAGATNDGPFAGYVLGWEFTVNSPITLTSVGWFDDGSGLSVSHPVGIYNSTGGLLGKATVTASDPLVPSVAPQPGAGFRYHALDSPFGLDVGTYRIGGLNPAGSTDKNYDFVPNLTSALGISYVHSYYQPASSLTFPSIFGDREKGYFGPNFQFNDGAGPPPPPPPPPPPTDKVPAISINLAADVLPGAAVGAANVAGVVRSTNWNDITIAQQSSTPLVNNSGATIPDLALTTNESFSFPGSAYDSGAVFVDPGNASMMRGHIYHGAPATVDVRIEGQIPYENYDVYVYYNSGAVTNTQHLSLLGSDLSDLGLSKTVFDIPGTDTEFINAVDATTNANYIKFSNLNNLDLPNFVLRAQADAGYGYINGFQIVRIILGDTDGNGTVEFSDLNTLLTNYGLAGDFSQGDFDNSSTVNFDDLNTLLTNYGKSIALSASVPPLGQSAVPEPSTLMLASIGFVGMVYGAWRRARTRYFSAVARWDDSLCVCPQSVRV